MSPGHGFHPTRQKQPRHPQTMLPGQRTWSPGSSSSSSLCVCGGEGGGGRRSADLESRPFFLLFLVCVCVCVWRGAGSVALLPALSLLPRDQVVLVSSPFPIPSSPAFSPRPHLEEVMVLRRGRASWPCRVAGVLVDTWETLVSPSVKGRPPQAHFPSMWAVERQDKEM